MGLQSTWRIQGRHILAIPGWCACGKAADAAFQSSPVQEFFRADAGAEGPKKQETVSVALHKQEHVSVTLYKH